jgi:hypothetical protein
MGTEHGQPGQPADGDHFNQVTVEISAEEAAGGALRAVSVPPGDHTVTVHLPPGVRDGTVIRLAGAGRPDPAGGAEDLVLHVRIVEAPATMALPPDPAAPEPDPMAAPPAPMSGPPDPMSGPPDPMSGPPGPMSGTPYTIPGPYPPHQFPGQPLPGQQPYPTQQFPAQPYPTQQFPGQPYPGQPYPGQPFAMVGQPGMPGAPTSRRGRGKLIAGIAAGAVLVLLVGCCGVGALLRDDEDPQSRPAGGTGATGSAEPDRAAAAATPQEYQAALTAADGRLTQAITGLTAARTPAAAETAAAAVATAAETAGTDLSSLTPPEAVSGAHQALLTALTDLAAAAGETETAAADRQVCTGSSATALFSRSAAIDAVRAAGQQLAAADPTQGYKIGAGLPKDTKDTARRAKNGTYVKRTRGGSGQMKIKNGGSSDSVISVVKNGSKRSAITVYLRAKGKHTVTGVRDGTYRVYMSSGADWDARAKRFTRNCGFSRFDDSFKFTTTSRQFTIWEITLTPIVGGNASTSGVDPDDFPG